MTTPPPAGEDVVARLRRSAANNGTGAYYPREFAEDCALAADTIIALCAELAALVAEREDGLIVEHELTERAEAAERELAEAKEWDVRKWAASAIELNEWHSHEDGWTIMPRTLAESLAAELAEARRDAERWQAMAALWAAYGVVTLRQEENGFWSIDCTEGIDHADSKVVLDSPNEFCNTAIAKNAP